MSRILFNSITKYHEKIEKSTKVAWKYILQVPHDQLNSFAVRWGSRDSLCWNTSVVSPELDASPKPLVSPNFIVHDFRTRKNPPLELGWAFHEDARYHIGWEKLAQVFRVGKYREIQAEFKFPTKRFYKNDQTIDDPCSGKSCHMIRCSPSWIFLPKKKCGIQVARGISCANQPWGNDINP